jgi:NADH-quinone oxidoreductase subunit E/NADP-reducing hydrogenase subunit HndA
MTRLLEQIAENDPLVIPEKREIIDKILEENRDLPGATMVVLNELQSRWFYHREMQAYAPKLQCSFGAIHGVVTFLLHHSRDDAIR